jgi:hypothetical protein
MDHNVDNERGTPAKAESKNSPCTIREETKKSKSPGMSQRVTSMPKLEFEKEKVYTTNKAEEPKT